MKLDILYGLPFVKLEVQYQYKRLILNKVLIDTGSAGTIFNADLVDKIGVVPEENDIVDIIRGVGGVEYVYVKNFKKILLGDIGQENFQVEIGNMDYGLEIDGILGFDFIESTKLVIDSKKLVVYQSN